MQQLAETTQHTTYYCKCPNCQANWQFAYGHLLNQKLPYQGGQNWSCDSCGLKLNHLIINTDKTVTLDFGPEQAKRNIPGLLLVKLNVEHPKPIYLIIEYMIYSHDLEKTWDDLDSNLTYYINEGTCPWNILHQVIIEEQDTDPHGILEYVQLIIKPTDYDRHKSYADWCELFNRLPITDIDGDSTPTQLLLSR